MDIRAISLFVIVGHMAALKDFLPALCDSYDSYTTLSIRNAGNITSPFHIISGCWFSVELYPKEGIYLVLNRTHSKQYLTLEFEDVDSLSHFVVFSFESQPQFTDTIKEYQWYSWDDKMDGSRSYYMSKQWPPNDVYHCGGPLCKQRARESHIGELYITISAHFAKKISTGRWKFEFHTPKEYIQPEQMIAIADLRDLCCKNQKDANNNDWNWNLESKKKHGIKNIREKKFCDWQLTYSNQHQQLTQNSCEDLQDIYCDENGNVIEIILSGKGLECELPSIAFNQFPQLKKLSLSQNRISGNLTQFAENLVNLEFLFLGDNGFSGTLPCFQSDALKELSLANNDITGTIPDCLGKLPSLQVLTLGYNLLSGTLPNNLIGKDSQINRLFLSNCGLEGTLPNHNHSLPHLAQLDLSRNSFHGSFPPTLLMKTPNLYRLDLSFNNFIGTFPSIGPKLGKLRQLDISNNQFNGSITNQLDNIQLNLDDASNSNLDFSNNRFSGPLPKIIYNLTQKGHFLKSIDFSANNFDCDLDKETWPTWVRKIQPINVGKCVPVIKINRISPSKVMPGAKSVPIIYSKSQSGWILSLFLAICVILLFISWGMLGYVIWNEKNGTPIYVGTHLVVDSDISDEENEDNDTKALNG